MLSNSSATRCILAPLQLLHASLQTGVCKPSRFPSLSTYLSVLQDSPEVSGSKFVIGAIIPGSNNQERKEDAFVVVRFLYHSQTAPQILRSCLPDADDSAPFLRRRVQACVYVKASMCTQSFVCRYTCTGCQSGMAWRHGRSWG